ncbi:Flp pilus assembly pilin Flp [Altererythrobacter atlanticus]|uniref:TadE-like protein n=1 Tax=Croceibacterium atlanticum TaxID=1267766 RepID=A0A0F7KQS8_9SPHN|nr:TadE/TadG family type IV pilus assembly protein [Croceibacterium atlanticum]AKH41532.1 TadE-like protein [Croceibacterium atlanticum]MBB5732994.1 Flp pilus assembly pilin Flp [Croceibacterium atlanticum]
MMRSAKSIFRALSRREDGTAVMEFGLIAPVFVILLMGIYDLSHMVYARSVLAGAVERAARDSSLEGGDTDVADQIVEDAIRPVLPGVDLDPQRLSYFDFADIGRPEQFDDENGNNVCDNGEAYVDENRNGIWDADIGVANNGGAGDVVIYTVTATYSPLFKIPFMPEMWNERTLTATAVKKNQPFANQLGYATTAGTCSS